MERLGHRVIKAAPRGFSLIEIMVALLLVGIIAAMVGVAFINQYKDGQRDVARTQAYDIAKALELYRLRFGSYPTTEQGLNVLVNPPRGEPIMERIPQDPWGNDYIYVYPGEMNRNKPDIRSNGPDGIDNPKEYIGNWPEEKK